MTLGPGVTPAIAVSLVIQAAVPLVQWLVPYKPQPDKIATGFTTLGTAIPLLLTIFGIPLYPVVWNFRLLWFAIVLAAALAVVAVLPPLLGLFEAKLRKEPQIFARSRFLGHLLTNLGGAAGAWFLVWMARTIIGFDSFSQTFADKAALNCVLPMTILVNLAFVRWQQIDADADLDDRVKRGDDDWDKDIVGFSLKHAHQLANLVALIVFTFTATTTLLYLFAFALRQAKVGSPLGFSWQIGIAIVVSLVFFYLCGGPWSRQHRAVFLTFLTGTPAALAAAIVWTLLLKHGKPTSIFAVSIAVVGYVLYTWGAVEGNRGPGEKRELYYFGTAAFALALAGLGGILYLY